MRPLVLLGSLFFVAAALAAPDEAALGKAEGYPICPPSPRIEMRCLVWAKHCPGVVRSLREGGAELLITMPAFEATAVLRRVSDPREQATVIAFLLSDEASYITGVDIPVDGGTLLLNRGVPTASGAAPPTPGGAYRI